MTPPALLDRRHVAIRQVVADHHALDPRLFGSVSRGEDTEDSDRDLLVDPAEGMSLFDIAAMRWKLHDLLGVKVDVVSARGLSDGHTGLTRRPHNKLRLDPYLQLIVEAIERIPGYTAGMTYDGYRESSITQDAEIRNLEVIGAACRNILRLYPDYAAEHASVPWRSPYEMRNALSHGYFDIDLGTAWTTIEVDLPAFDAQIRALPSDAPG